MSKAFWDRSEIPEGTLGPLWAKACGAQHRKMHCEEPCKKRNWPAVSVQIVFRPPNSKSNIPPSSLQGFLPSHIMIEIPLITLRPLPNNGSGNLELWAGELLFPGSLFQLNVCTRNFPDREILISRFSNQEISRALRLLRGQKSVPGTFELACQKI